MSLKVDEYGLTPKQRLFADEYFVHGKAIDATKKAGYEGNHLNVRASRLKNDPKILQYLEVKAKGLLQKDGGRILALAKQIESKDEYIIRTLELMEDIKDPSNATKFKYWELIGRLRHLNERESQNRGIVINGKEIGINEIMERTSRLTGVLREIRFEAEIMQKNKPITEKNEVIPEVIDITPVTEAS